MTGTAVRAQACPGAGSAAGAAVSTPACLQHLAHARGRKALAGGDLAQAQPLALERDDARLRAGIAHGPAKALALGPRVGQPRPHALDDDLALELGKGADDVEEQPAHGRGGVDRLGVADEVHAEVAELLQGRDQRAEGAGEAVVLPDQHAVEAAPAGVGHQGIEVGRAPAAAHVAAGLVHVLAMHHEAAASGIVPQLPQLQLRALLARGHPRVDRHPHRPAAASAPCSAGTILQVRAHHGQARKGRGNAGLGRPESVGFSARPRSCRRTSADPFSRAASMCEDSVRILAIADIASHQVDQFLFFTGATDAEVVASAVGNFANPGDPGLEDFGEMLLGSPQGRGYIRVDWYTPDGLPTWGDGRLTILGTEGHIELRKYVDIAGRPGTDHLFLVDAEGTRHVDCSDADLPYNRNLVRDVLERTGTAMPQAHAFKATELALLAEAKAARLGHLR